MYLKKHMKKTNDFIRGFGVILFGFGFANFAMAVIDPIPGVDIIVRKSPGGIAIQVKTGADGTYKFTGLAPGTYDLIISGQPVESVTVGTDGKFSGIVTLINSVDTSNDDAVRSKAPLPTPRSR